LRVSNWLLMLPEQPLMVSKQVLLLQKRPLLVSKPLLMVPKRVLPLPKLLLLLPKQALLVSNWVLMHQQRPFLLPQEPFRQPQRAFRQPQARFRELPGGCRPPQRAGKRPLCHRLACRRGICGVGQAWRRERRRWFRSSANDVLGYTHAARSMAGGNPIFTPVPSSIPWTP